MPTTPIAIAIAKLACRRCGYHWFPRVADVKRCPKCLSYRWQTPRKPKQPS